MQLVVKTNYYQESFSDQSYHLINWKASISLDFFFFQGVLFQKVRIQRRHVNCEFEMYFMVENNA